MPPLSIEQAEILSEKKLLGTITPMEQASLNEWARQVPGDEMYWASGDADETALRNRLLARIRESAGMEDLGTPVRRMPLSRRFRWTAAAVLLILLTGGYLLLHDPSAPSSIAAVDTIPKHTGAPGHDGAILTLAGGQQIILDSAQNGNIALQGISRVMKQNGQLLYQQQDHPNDQEAAVQFNTLTTQRGRQYQVLLPDGTRAWLNAASSLTYPTVFKGNNRSVTVSGEVYFEVADNPHQPFVVTAGSTDITVLGTHFDVMSYNDEDHLRTTLLEGAISVKQADRSAVLHPGEQARINTAAHQISVKKVDAADAIAWVNGKLSLESDDLAALMRNISRWYNVDWRSVGKLPQTRLFGTIDRNINLSDVLSALGSYGIKTRLDGNTIIVSDK